MKKECEIVQDLLFGYADGTLKNASKELVEEHIKNCHNCKTVLNELQENNETGATEQEVDYLKGIKRKINKKSIIIAITSILLIILAIVHIIVYATYREYADNAYIEMYLKNDITEEEKANIEKAIKEVASEYELEYISSQQALDNLKEQFGDKAYLLKGYDEDPIFPSSYKVKTDFSNIEKIEERVKGMQGVDRITAVTSENPYVVTYYYLFYKDQF